MTKKSLEEEPWAVAVAKVHASLARSGQCCDLAKKGLVCLTAFFCIRTIMQELTVMAGCQRGSLEGLAKVISALRVDSIVGYTVAALTGIGWYRERRQRKKMVEKNGELRHERESKDGYKARSGLDKRGDSPESDE